MRWRTAAVTVAAVVALLAGCAATPTGPVYTESHSAAPSTSAPAVTTTPGTRPTAPQGAVHLTAAGDYGAYPASADVLSALGRAGQDANLALGDLSYGRTGREWEWCDFVTRRIRPGLPFELVAGNHESDGANGDIGAFSSCLPNRLPGLVGTYGREYYVDLPQAAPVVRVLMVSPGLTFPDGAWAYTAGSPHYTWTRRAIDGARAAGIPWVVVGMHKPCLSVGIYACDIGADLLHLLVSERVDLVLSGHEHLYQRTKQLAEGPKCPSVAIGSYRPGCVAAAGNALTGGAGTVFVTAGTGGAALRPVDRADSESGYFAATAGAGAVPPAHGYLDLRISPTRLAVSLVRASGGGSVDAFVLRR